VRWLDRPVQSDYTRFSRFLVDIAKSRFLLGLRPYDPDAKVASAIDHASVKVADDRAEQLELGPLDCGKGDGSTAAEQRQNLFAKLDPQMPPAGNAGRLEPLGPEETAAADQIVGPPCYANRAARFIGRAKLRPRNHAASCGEHGDR
jgi:hypothetical protein